nr:MarR family [uncultured bacterium]
MNSEADVGSELSSRLGYLLKRAFLELEDLHAIHLAPIEVNARELTVLLLLGGREPESQQQAAERLGVDQQAAERLGVDRTTMVGLLDGLESKGLTARQTDPNDRRRNVIGLTAAGSRALDKAKKASDEAERQLLEALSEAEAAQLRALLGRIGVRGRPANESGAH